MFNVDMLICFMVVLCVPQSVVDMFNDVIRVSNLLLLFYSVWVQGPVMVQGPVDRVEGTCALTKDPVNLGQVELICVLKYFF